MKECSQCSCIESWDHIIRYSKTNNLYLKFIVDLYKELKEIQIELTTNEMLRSMINDIRKYLKGNEDNDEYETNQYFVGIKYLFRRFAIKNWYGTDFSSNMFVEYNRIMIKHCMNFYVTCWYYRNEMA